MSVAIYAFNSLADNSVSRHGWSMIAQKSVYAEAIACIRPMLNMYASFQSTMMGATVNGMLFSQKTFMTLATTLEDTFAKAFLALRNIL